MTHVLYELPLVAVEPPWLGYRAAGTLYPLDVPLRIAVGAPRALSASLAPQAELFVTLRER